MRLDAPSPLIHVAPAGLRPVQAAQYLGVGVTFSPVSSSDPIRVRGNGTGKRPVVIYLRRDLDAWLEAQAAQRDPFHPHHVESELTMVYRRTGGGSYTFKARLPSGRTKQLQRESRARAKTAGKALAQRIEAMWSSLALEHRAWDLLEPILTVRYGERAARLGHLYDLWVSTRYAVGEVRRLLSDVDLEPLVNPWRDAHRRGVSAGYAEHVIVHVRWLLPEGVPALSAGSPPPGSRSGWRPIQAGGTPYGGSTRPGPCSSTMPPRSTASRQPDGRRVSPGRGEAAGRLQLGEVQRIVDAQPTPERRALFAILYGTGIEVSTALRLNRADVWDSKREIRAAGTKTHTRDRLAVAADWAWPIIQQHIRHRLPTARLFPPDWKPYQVNHWQRWIVTERLKLTRRLKVHAARHHWAVMRLRAGVPVAVVQQQLGHSTPMLTLTTYGAFIPTGQDRAHWEKQVTKSEQRRSGSNQ